MRCKCCDVVLPQLAKDTELCYKCLSVVHDTLYNNEFTVYDVRYYSELEIPKESNFKELEHELRSR